MKLRKLMLVTILLLAVLTIGAVSASDDSSGDNLTVDDTTPDSIAESGVGDVDVLTEGDLDDEDSDEIDEDDFDVYLEEDLTLDDEFDVALVVECPEEAVGGTVSVHVDKNKVDERTVGEDDYYGMCWLLDDLGIGSAGDYLIDVYFANSDTNLLLFSDILTVYGPDALNPGDFDVWMEDLTVNDENETFLTVGCPEEAVGGTVSVHVDGVEVDERTVGEDDYYDMCWSLHDLGIGSAGEYWIEVYFADSGSNLYLFYDYLTVADSSSEEYTIDDFYFSKSNEVSLYYTENIISLNYSPTDGFLNVYVDDVPKCELYASSGYYGTFVYLKNLGITETGVYDIVVEFEYDDKEIELAHYNLTVNNKVTSRDFTVSFADNIPVNFQNRTIITVKCLRNATGGNIYVEVDNHEKIAKQIIGEYVYFTLEDLGITEPDSYYLGVYYRNGTDNFYIDSRYLSVAEEGEEYEYFLSLNIPDPVQLGDWGSTRISITNKDDARGNLTLFIDDKKVSSYTLNGNDWAASLEIPNMALGMHNYTISYSGDGTHAAFNKSGKLNITYYLEMYASSGVYYGKPVEVSVRSYEGLLGDYVTVRAGGKTYEVRKGYNSVSLTDLPMGLNLVSLSYAGDSKYSARTVYMNITVIPHIDVNDNSIWGSDDETISLILPDGANGTLVAYDQRNNNIIKSKDVTGGKNVISFSDMDLGDYPIKVSYENGNYYAYNEYKAIQVKPDVTAPSAMYAKGDATVSISMPADYKGVLSVEIKPITSDYYGYYVEYGNVIFTASCNVTGGNAALTISRPGGNGKHGLFISYADDNGYKYSSTYQLYINENSPDFDLDIDVDDEYEIGKERVYLDNNLPSNHDGELSVLINGVPFELRYVEVEEYYYRYVIDLSSLDAGNYTAIFTYSNDTYYKDSSDVVKFSIVPIVAKFSDEMEINNGLGIKLADGVEGTLVINIDGNEVYNEFINAESLHDEDWEEYYSTMDGYIYIFSDLGFGMHDYGLTFTYDNKTFTKSGSFNLTYHLNVWVPYECYYGEDTTIQIYFPDSATGCVTVIAAGKTYNVPIPVNEEDSYYLWVTLSDLEYGTNLIQVTYNGDEFYPPKTVYKNLTTGPHFNIPFKIIYSGDRQLSFAIGSDATGNFVAEIDGVTYSEPVENGKAVITLPESLKLGSHSINAYYEGNYGKITAQNWYFYIIPNITIPTLSTKGEHVVSIDLPEEYNGTFTVDFSGKTYVANVTNGHGEAILSNLTHGMHSMGITFERGGYEYYYYSDYISECTVYGYDGEYKLNIDVPDEILVNSTWELEYYMPTYASGNVTVYVDNELFTVLKVRGSWEDNGIYGDLELGYLAPGFHTIEFVYSGDEYINSARCNDSFYVLSVIFPNNIRAGYFTDEHPNDYVVEIQGLTGTLAVYIDDVLIKSEEITDDDYVINLDNITSGHHTYKLVYSGDNPFTKEGEFNATYYTYLAMPYWAAYGQDLEFDVILPKDATGTITATVNGIDYTSVVIGGKATVTIPKLHVAGKYDLSIVYSGDGKYYSKVFEETINVEYRVVAYNDNGTLVVSIELPEDAEGTLWVEIDNVDEEPVDIVNGSAVFKKSDLEYGIYRIYAYARCGNYSTNSFWGNVNIAPDYKIDPQLKVTADDVDYGKSAVIEISISPLAQYDEVIINVDGKYYAVKVYDGEASKSISGLKPGEYTVRVSYDGNDYLLEGENTTTFRVISTQIDPSLTVSASNIAQGQAAVIGITMNPLATGNVSVSVDGENYTVTLTEGTGNVTVSGLAGGTYTVTAKYAGDENFLESEKTTSFTVSTIKADPELSVSAGNINVGQDEVIMVTVNADITSGVTLKVNNRTYDVELSNGKGNVVISELGAGTYTVIAAFGGNSNFDSDTKTTSFTVSKLPSEISIIVDSTHFVGDVFDIEIINNTAVEVTVNGIPYPVEDGKVKIDTDALGADTYTVIASANGDDMYLGSSANATFTISKRDAPVTITVGSQYNVGDVFEIAVSNVTPVSVTINGNPYAVADGMVVIDTASLAADTYTVIASCEATNMYLGSSANATFTISKRDAPVTITVGSLYNVGDVFEIVVSNVTPVSVTINGNSYAVEDGKVVIDTASLAADTYTVIASCEATDMYRANSTTKTFTVSKRNAGLNVVANSIMFEDENMTVIITIDENATGEVTYSFNNINDAVEISNGKGNVTFRGLDIGTYSITVKFAGDAKFASDEKTVTFNVRGNTTVPDVIAPSLDNVKSNEEIVIELPQDATGNIILSVNGQDYVFEVTNGKAIVKLPNLANGNFEYNLVYSGDDNYSPLTVSNGTMKVENPPSKPADGSGQASNNANSAGTATQNTQSQPAAQSPSADVIKLTLKKVKVKKSAKKLVIRATLKINGKAVKGKKIRFKFNGKTYKVKTNKKGIAKLTIKKSVLKKLKVGKKITYSATYGKVTKKVTVKVKK